MCVGNLGPCSQCVLLKVYVSTYLGCLEHVLGSFHHTTKIADLIYHAALDRVTLKERKC